MLIFVHDCAMDRRAVFGEWHRGEGDTAVVKLVTHTYLSLLQHPSHITGEAALRLVLSDLRAQLSRVTEEGMMVATLIFNDTLWHATVACKRLQPLSAALVHSKESALALTQS